MSATRSVRRTVDLEVWHHMALKAVGVDLRESMSRAFSRPLRRVH